MYLPLSQAVLDQARSHPPTPPSGQRPPLKAQDWKTWRWAGPGDRWLRKAEICPPRFSSQTAPPLQPPSCQWTVILRGRGKPERNRKSLLSGFGLGISFSSWILELGGGEGERITPVPSQAIAISCSAALISASSWLIFPESHLWFKLPLYLWAWA